MDRTKAFELAWSHLVPRHRRSGSIIDQGVNEVVEVVAVWSCWSATRQGGARRGLAVRAHQTGRRCGWRKTTTAGLGHVERMGD